MRSVLSTVLASFVVISVTLAISTRAASQTGCDTKQEQWFQQGEVKDWNGLYSRFKRFGDCDDGAIGEGFSETVAQLFLRQWTNLGRLDHLSTGDNKFGPFVLRHVDATLSEDELKGIIVNARSHCPAGETHLCRAVQTKATRSLAELRKTSNQ
jgi:hypothetical protein